MESPGDIGGVVRDQDGLDIREVYEPCSFCDGHGIDDGYICVNCDGHGVVPHDCGAGDG